MKAGWFGRQEAGPGGGPPPPLVSGVSSLMGRTFRGIEYKPRKVAASKITWSYTNLCSHFETTVLYSSL